MIHGTHLIAAIHFTLIKTYPFVTILLNHSAWNSGPPSRQPPLLILLWWVLITALHQILHPATGSHICCFYRRCCNFNALAAIWANPWACLSPNQQILDHLNDPPKEKTQGLGFTVDQSINTKHASRAQEPRRPRWVSMRVGRLGDSLDSIHNRCSTKNTKKRLLMLGVALSFILAFPESWNHPWHTPGIHRSLPCECFEAAWISATLNTHLFFSLARSHGCRIALMHQLGILSFWSLSTDLRRAKNCFWHNLYRPEVTGACETIL